MLKALMLKRSVYPTYVGMNRLSWETLQSSCRMPHVCGDEPGTFRALEVTRKYAPRMWV